MADLKLLMQKKAKLESDIARVKKAEATAARKADSRRKIVLGGVLIAAVRDGAFSGNAVRGLVSRFASERDQTAFEDFEFETAGKDSTVPETAPPVPEEAA